MLRSLVAYDAQGNIVATLDHVVAQDDAGNVIGLVDFAAHEENGGSMREVWDVQRLDQPVPLGIAKQVLGRDPKPDEAITLSPDHPWRIAHETVVGAATWPEWLGGAAYDFKVELDPAPGQARARIAALVHKKSGHRRQRKDIEAAIAERTNEAKVVAQKQGQEQRAFLRAKGVPEETVMEFTDPPHKVDLRDIVGGPKAPLLLDEDGKTMKRPKVERPDLPIVGR